MTITVVFDPPLLSDSPAVFNSKAFTLVGDLNTFASEANSTQAAINTSESNAATSASNASTSASNAATSATNAGTSETTAATSATNAANSYDAFDDRFLGAKASDPTLDNDGDALLVGALYWNTTSTEMRAWSGSAWVTTSVANAVSRGGDTMTGALSVPAGATGAQVPQAQEIGGLAVTQRAVGTVTESGGLPTGAIIESYTSGATYVIKWADGTMAMTVRETVTNQAISGAYSSAFAGNRTWTFPEAFVATPTLVPGYGLWGTGASWQGSPAAVSSSAATLQFLDLISRATGTTFTYSAMAIGRWFA